jgi:prophage regulatory protein
MKTISPPGSALGGGDAFFLKTTRKGRTMSTSISNLSSTSQSSLPRILRLPEVISRTGLPRASIYQQMALGAFPKPIALTVRSRGWIESEIAAWIETRIVARGGEQ